MNWERIKTVNITTADGEPDTLHFEQNSEGGFRIINDFGNECISFDVMTGFEAITRIKESMEFFIYDEINETFEDNNSNNDQKFTDEDCEGI